MDLFKVHDKPIDLRVAEYKFTDIVSESTCLVSVDYQRRLFISMWKGY